MHLVTKLLPLQIFSWTLYQMTPAYTSVIFICQKDWALQNFDFVFAFLFLEQGTLLPFPISTIHGNVTNEETEDKY